VAETGQKKPLKIRAFYEYIGAVTKEFLSDRRAMVPRKRVAIYARISTEGRGQNPGTQLLALREYVARPGFVPMGEYVDYASDTGGSSPIPKTAEKEGTTSITGEWRLPEQPLRR
jgi:hypothetical protein